LQSHVAVEKVNYPGLESHPEHATAREYFAGYGSMLSFKLKAGQAASEKLQSTLQIILHAPSSGGPESLLTLPAHTTHSFMKPEERAAIGISDDLIRLSVGLENEVDIITDLEQALRKI
jgi:cystathionine beta-lyase/cystathionine gamma-synthase